MTFELSDIKTRPKPKLNHIKTANGGIVPVKGAGSIEISPTLKLSNCLYVPFLSHKLLSISHVTKELNCTSLMHPPFVSFRTSGWEQSLGVSLNAKDCII